MPGRPAGQLAGDTELMLKSGTRSIGMAARVNQSFHSRGSVRSVRPACDRPPEQVDRRLVEPEVVHRAGHLAALDEEDAVAGEAGQQQRLRVDLADVPERGEQQAALGGRDHLRRRHGGASGPRGSGCRRRRWPARSCFSAQARGPDQVGQHAVGDPVDRRGGQAVVEHRGRARGGRHHLERAPSPGPGRPGRCAASAGARPAARRCGCRRPAGRRRCGPRRRRGPPSSSRGRSSGR